MFDKARWRLTIFFAGVVALILVVVGVAVFATTRAALYDGVNDDLESRATRQVLRPFQNRPVGQRGQAQLQAIIEAATAGGYFYAITAPSGEVRTTRNADPEALGAVRELEGLEFGDQVFVDTKNADGEHFRVYATAATPDGVILQVGRSTEPEREALRRLLFILGAGGFAGLVLAVGSGYWLAGRALRPIKVAMDKQQQFVADASHELRTPLSLIRANAELLKRKAEAPVQTNIDSVDDIIQETDRLTALVGQMLTLARADAGQTPLRGEPVDLVALAADRADDMRLLAAEKGVDLAVNADGALIVEGDELRLRELVTILLDNSIKYCATGAQVRVDVTENHGKAVLRVADTGPGIPREALDRVFERFYRLDKGRSREMGGTGLGLSIARWIAQSHHGAIRIDSDPGRGTTVTVELPLARHPSP